MGHTLPNIFPRNTYTYLLRLKSNKKIQYIGFTRPKFFPTNPYRYRLRLILEIKYTTGVIPPPKFFPTNPYTYLPGHEILENDKAWLCVFSTNYEKRNTKW